ncbi:hypothetical protein LBMAG52_14230 [Planctomycetia bacterium]|nr:hypothetical protein LBMAG52_14230 [Planctomycetia bacterium]
MITSKGTGFIASSEGGDRNQQLDDRLRAFRPGDHAAVSIAEVHHFLSVERSLIWCFNSQSHAVVLNLQNCHPNVAINHQSLVDTAGDDPHIGYL